MRTYWTAPWSNALSFHALRIETGQTQRVARQRKALFLHPSEYLNTCNESLGRAQGTTLSPCLKTCNPEGLAYSDLVGPDGKPLKRVGAKGIGESNIAGIPATCHEDTSDARSVITRVKGIPLVTQIDLKPPRKVHGTRDSIYADIAQITRAIARWNVHAAAKRDR